MAAGVVPLLPFLGSPPPLRFPLSVAATCLTLFGVGASRALVTRRPWGGSGLEMLVVGGLAGAVAFGAGLAVGRIGGGLR